ncbi:uncharacterized protein LOC106646252 [Copidosoma floridanum]|uniref:uncharacterized protein LOC106646252 n=1 Tax=Copidosoma floridanum TaxID=29053 RepID=UPI0006C96C76|nr:uncharacterized protein LOC106646252 [Copidosoma floridanum]
MDPEVEENISRKLGLVDQLAGLIKALNENGDAGKYKVSSKPEPKRQMGPACTSSCRRRCFERLSEEERETLYTEFWSLSSRMAQWEYIAASLFVKPKGKATTKDRVVISRRNNSRVYFFTVPDRVEQVCKTMFLNTLGINNSWTFTVCKKLRINGYIKADERGNFTHRPRKKAN